MYAAHSSSLFSLVYFSIIFSEAKCSVLPDYLSTDSTDDSAVYL